MREDVYQNLKRLSISQGMSFNDVINSRLAGNGLTAQEKEKKMQDSNRMFEYLAKKGKKNVDVVKAVRELRDAR